MANAMRARMAARKENREAISVTVMCCENEERKATKETPHAISRNVPKTKKTATWLKSESLGVKKKNIPTG